MPRIVRCGVIQATCEWSPEKYSLADIKEKMIAKHEKMIAAAAKKDVQILGLQELFYGPYFCAEQNAKWYELTESVPGGPTLVRMQKLAKKYKMVLVVPIYEVEMAGVFYNTAAVFDADGSYLGKYRKHHIPHCHPGFWEKFYFTPGNAGYPVFETRYGKVGVYICYDRHFPEGARILGIEWRGDCFQSFGDGGGAFRISLGAGAAGARGGQSIFCGGDQSRGNREAVEHRRILRQELFLQSAREDRGAGQPRQRRACGGGSGLR